MRKPLRITAGAILVALLLSSCMTATPQVTDVRELADDEVIIVGNIEFEPDYEPVELENRNAAFLLGEQLVTPENSIFTIRKHTFVARIGEEFYVKAPASHPMFYSAASVVLPSTETLYFPGGIEYDYPPDAKIVYLGTIRYYRDEYNDIKEVRIIDDYDRVKSAVLEKYGPDSVLHRAEVKLVEKEK